MDGAMGKEEDVVEAVLTCEGDFHDPELNSHIERFRHRLKDLLLTDKQKLNVKKVEPWNSVKVTVTIPREAAIRLRQLAQAGSDALRQIGVLSVHIQGDSQISLTLAGRNNEQTQLVLHTPSASQGAGSSIQFSVANTESSIPSGDELGASPGPSSDEVARKNIADYFRHGSTALRQNAVLIDSILGTGATSTTGLGIGLGLPPPPDSFHATPGNSSSLRPNNLSATMMPNQGLRGSQISSSYPFTKASGAFHPPVPRLPTSAGQSSATNPIHHMPSGSNNSNRLAGALGQDSLVLQPGLSVSGPNHQELTAGINSFSPVNRGRHPPTTSSINFNSDILHVPPPSSPSNFMMDLPPPPPYPHSTNSTSRPGKPVTASSPLLVNLLQTDPLAAAAGMASGNPNKPIAAGDSGGTPPKKKRRTKKAKDGLVKPFSLNDSSTGCKPGSYQHILASGADESRIPKMTDDSPTSGLSASVSARDRFSVDLVQSRAGALPASHIPDSFSFRPDSNSSFSADRPFSESQMDTPSSSGFQSDSNSRSAIGAGSSSSKHSDSHGQESFPQDLDPFTLEIAAGKIINPYTGQLEPRDSVVDTGQVRGKDQCSHSQGDNFATRMLAKKAKELEEINKNAVPNSSPSSSVLDVHVVRTAIPSPVSVSTSTAAIVRSGGPNQGSCDKFTSSVPSHSRKFISDSSGREAKESSIYAVNAKPWQVIVGSTDVGPKVSSQTSGDLSQMIATTTVSNSLQSSFTPTAVSINGPLAASQTVKRNVIPSQHQHIGSPSYSSGASSAPSGSVIYSNVTMSSSVPLASSHPTSVALTQDQRLAVPTASVTSSLQAVQTSPPRTVSASSVTPLSRTGSALLPLSSVVQVTERLTSVESRHISCDPQTQAASSESRGGNVAPESSSPNLLNSLPDKLVDSQSSTESPPDNKASSEGDENSNHSVLAADSLPEHSGTAVLLEHSGVKTENHDSGVGSSSERSDDTPSEPGDEFRSSHTGTENEDGGNKTSLQKTVNCKLESKVSSTSNTITVGYIMNPCDNANQSKLTSAKDNGHFNKGALMNTPATSNSDISQFYDSHIKSMEKQTDLVTSGGQQASSVNWAGEKDKNHSLTNIYGNLKENGPSSDDLDNIPGLKMNGPSSQGNIEKMIMAMNDIQQKKMRSSPKHNKFGLMDVPTEHLKLQAEVFEKMSKLHQFAESTKESSDVLMKANNSDKADSPDTVSQQRSNSDDRADHLIFDMEELVNGKTPGHGISGMEGKGGSNITSIYSKRSSPVNVNMLNHIYAPGLPLPRRLTESVQRLVKPLPASETSVSVPQMRPCKSSSSVGSPRAGSGTTSHSSLRMSVQSGARSPGASMPKLISSDKHSLLSGGLDLAGLSSLQYSSTPSSEHASLSGIMVNCKKGMPRSADILLKDPQSFSSSHHSPPDLMFDSRSYSGKMLSQSYPPHKSRDLHAMPHINHDLLSNLQSNSSGVEKNYLSTSLANSHHGQFSKSRTEPPSSPSYESRVSASVKLSEPASSIHNHVSSDSLTRMSTQVLASTEHSHSSSNNYVCDSSSAYTTHSNCSSPVMPILQRGQEPPVTPTLASSMPIMSSQLPSSISSAKEISQSNGSSAPPTSNATVTTHNKHVPYSNNVVTVAGTVKSPSVSSSLPVLSPVSSSPQSSGKTEFKPTSSPTYSAPPKLTLSSISNSAPPKLTKVQMPTSLSPASQRSGGSGSSQFSRNLFESVSGTFSNEAILSSKSDQQAISLDLSGTVSTQKRPLTNDSENDSSGSVLALVESKVDLVKNILHKPAESGGAEIPVNIFRNSKADVLKSNTLSKSAHTFSEVTNSQPTEVVNLDLPVSSHNSQTNNETSTMSSSARVGEVSVKDTSPVSGSVSTNASPPIVPSLVENSSAASLSETQVVDVSISGTQSVDTVAEVIASVAAGRDETNLKAPLSFSTVFPSPVKEPILETLATALGTTTSKPVNKTPVKSFVEKQVSAAAVGLELRHRPDEDGVGESKMVTIQSGPQKPSDYSSRHFFSDFNPAESTVSRISEALSRRTTRKRKSTHSESDSRDGENETSSTEATLAKQSKLMQGSSSPEVKVMPNTAITGDSNQMKPNSQIKTDGVENRDGKSIGAVKFIVGTVESHDKGKVDRSPRGQRPVQEEKEPTRTAKSHRPSISDDKEQVCSKEDQLALNLSPSDDSRPCQSSSEENKDSAHKDNRAHRNVVTGANEPKEGRSHRTNIVTSPEDKDQPKEGRSHRAAAVDHKENTLKETLSKESKGHKSISNACEDKDDQKESRSRSAEDRDKAKPGRDSSAEKTTMPDKSNPQDEGGKKGHRIRRQFYAYVPEKSIDQSRKCSPPWSAYFDTPILSGRTRSKNKTTDQQEGGITQDGLAPHANSTDTQSQHSATGIQHSTPGKPEGSGEGKRSTRSVRVKDNPSDQNANKRRRVQQHR